MKFETSILTLASAVLVNNCQIISARVGAGMCFHYFRVTSLFPSANHLPRGPATHAYTVTFQLNTTGGMDRDIDQTGLQRGL